VGLPPGRYATGADPLPPAEAPAPVPAPAALELPADVVDLEAWLIATLRVAEPDRMACALRRAEAIAAARFPAREVVAAMRRVWATELTAS
jgi:hypothetical protein